MSEVSKTQVTKPRWQNKLSHKKEATASSYKPHIEAFIKARGKSDTFVQEDIDDYFAQIRKDDELKSQNDRESESKKTMRKAALKFYLNECLGLGIDFKNYKTKSAR